MACQPRPTVRVLAPLALVAGFPLGAALGGPAAESEDARTSVTQTLVDLGQGGDRERTVERLADLGPEHARLLLSILSGAEQLTHEGDGPLLTPTTEALFFEVFAAWPTERSCEEALRWAEAHDGSRGEYLLALRLLGTVGEREALPAFFDLLAQVRPEEQQHPRVTAQVERALAAILRRDARGHDVVSARLRELDALALARVAPAVVAVSDPRGLTLLDQLTGRSEELDVTVLASLADWAPSRVDCGDRAAAELAASFLTSSEEAARRQAAAAIGSLRDAPSVPTLIELLADSDPGVARTAHWALLQTVGGTLPADQEPWSDWLTAEYEWFDTHEGELDRALASEPGVAVQALRDICAHPLFRSELVDGVARALRNADMGVAMAACGTLASLKASCGIAPLIEALSDPRIEVRTAAERALQGLTGERLPKDARAWRQWLED